MCFLVEGEREAFLSLVLFFYLFSLINPLEWGWLTSHLGVFAPTRWAKLESQSHWLYSFGVCSDQRFVVHSLK